MPFKSQAQRRKFAQLFVEGTISNETFEEESRDRAQNTSGACRRQDEDIQTGEAAAPETSQDTFTLNVTAIRPSRSSAGPSRPDSIRTKRLQGSCGPRS